MTVLVGYLPTPEGDAAFSAALDEATRRNEPLVVLNSPRDGALVSAPTSAARPTASPRRRSPATRSSSAPTTLFRRRQNTDFHLFAFAAAGCGANVCKPLRSYDTGDGGVLGTPAVCSCGCCIGCRCRCSAGWRH